MRDQKTKYKIYFGNDQSTRVPRGNIKDELIHEQRLVAMCYPCSFPSCLPMRTITKYLES